MPPSAGLMPSADLELFAPPEPPSVIVSAPPGLLVIGSLGTPIM